MIDFRDFTLLDTRVRLYLLTLSLLTALIAGCGYKGELYLPAGTCSAPCTQPAEHSDR